MGLFLCSPHMSLGRYCQKNVVKGGSLEKKQVKGEMVRGWLSIEGGWGFKASAQYGRHKVTSS